MNVIRTACAALLLTAVAAPAAAQTNELNWDWCANEDGAFSSDQELAGCSAVIDTPGEPQLNRATAYMNRGVTYTNLMNFDRAIADLNQALRLNPGDAEILYNRGVAYYDSGDRARARADYDAALGIEPQYYDALFNRGLIFYDLKDYRRAIADYDAAIRLNAGDGDAYFNRGLALADSGDLARAVADFSDAIRLNPDDGEAYFERGRTRIKQGEDGAADLARAAELGFTPDAARLQDL